uniref:Uncharacterized protein n=1 Tax=Anopheles albimanus TaxID=7167 RepID=A0A182FAP2_ANOAL
MTSIVDVINHYQASINRSLDDKARIVHCIGKLYKLPISVRHLQDTGIGRTVNSLRKYDGEVGTAAKALVTKWKAMVAAEESDDGSGSQNNASDMDNADQQPDRSERRSDEEDGHADEAAQETHHETMEHYGEDHGDGEDKDTSYEEPQLRVDEEYHDAPESGNSSSSEEESDGQTPHQLHRTQDTAYEAKPDGERWSTSSHQESVASSKEEQHSSTSRSHHHHSSSSKSRSNSRKNSTSKSHRDDRRRHHREEESKSHKVSSSSSRSEHGSGRKSTHGDGTDSRQKERTSSKHHNTESSSNNGVATEHGSRTSSENRKDSSQKDRSKNERLGDGSSKRSANDSGGQESKRSRKDSVGSPSASSSHSKKSSKESSSTSSSKYRNRHEKASSSEKSHRSSESKSKRKEQKLKKQTEESDKAVESHEEDPLEEIDGAAGASFADALSMIGMPSSSKKKLSAGGNREKVTIIKSVTTSPSASSGHSSKSRLSPGASTNAGKSTIPTAQELLSSKAKLQPLPEAAEIVEALPMISPNYRPMPLNQTVMDCVFLGGSQGGGRGQRRPLTEEEALGQSMQSKNMRTKVYSGMKSTNAKGVIPTLYDLCIRLLQDHIDELRATGGIPFYILKPVLERATPNQLLQLEHFNPQFVEDSDGLWEQHCKRTFRSKQRNEEDLETWREMYLRCCEERDAKLKSLTKNIKLSQEQAAAPIRKTQLAYVDSAVKPPRTVLNKQARYGTARAPVVSPAARVAALKSGNVAQVGDARLRVLPGARDNAQAQVFQPTKPRKAPMMAKVLSSMKGFKTSFRR